MTSARRGLRAGLPPRTEGLARVALGLALCLPTTLAAAGCEDPLEASRRPAPARGPMGAASPRPGPVAAPPGPGSSPSDFGARRGTARPFAPPSPAAASTGPRGAEADEVDESGVDLRAALQRAFGSPAHCISSETRAHLGDSLSLLVSVRVTGTGRVVSATVTGSSLSDDDLSCMRRHAESLRLPSPIEDAPRTVAASVRYEVAGGSITTAGDPASAPPVRTAPPNSQPPGRTLPAAGSVTERPAGFVPPSSTLPAVD